MRMESKFRVRENETKILRRFERDDAGSLTVFGLFIFVLIIAIAGLAVDMMRYENERVGVQNTLDTAVVAATSLNQDANTNEEVTALVKSYFEKAGYDPDMVQVAPDIEIPAGGGEETLRTVTARVDFSMNTAFMNMLGIDELPGVVGGGAREGQQLIEIALVLDISGSMGWGSKLQNMKSAAKEFVTFVLNNNGADRVMISIIPYNMQVQMSEDLLGRLDIRNDLNVITPEPSHPGAVLAYNTQNVAARCVRFLDADFDSRRLSDAAEVEPSAKFARGNWNYAQPDPAGNGFWCGEGYPEMLLFQNDETKLHNHIDSLTARGMTAIDYGMKWATGVLDPSFRPIVQSMLTDTRQLRDDASQLASTSGNPYVEPSEQWMVPETVEGHPVDYGTENVYKYIVMMTDGSNTQHLDLKDEFKSGPSRVWWSEELSEEFDANGVEFDGFIVEMPANDPNERYYRPRSPTQTADDSYLSEADFAALDVDRVNQWTYHEVYNRFSVRNVADYFFRTDETARTAHRNAEVDTGGYGTADTNLARICDEAQENGWIEVYTVAFEAPAGGVNALQRCVENKPGNFFNVAGTQISTAFEAIAAEITKLRLTQ
ncbi:MAG: TadE/TadG family type IV pilus assembly protein [Pseudomonadota bacterium]